MIAARRAAAAPRRAARARASATSGTRPRPRYARRARTRRAARAAPTRRRRGPPVGMGASLGALAMLHAQRRYPGAFGALFLQSGSFFMPRFDAQESGFPRYARIVRFVRRDAARDGRTPSPCPSTLTCGAAEENVHNNRVMARALAAQGYEVACTRSPTLHNYTAGATRFDPHLTDLLARRGERAPRRAVLARDRRAPARSVAYGHWGRPVLAFPAEGGSAWRLRATTGWSARSATCSTAGRVKLYCVDSLRRRVVVEPRRPARGARAPARRYESWILDQVVPFIHDDCGGAQDDRHRRRQPRRLPRRQLRAQARRPVPARRSACRATTTRRAGTAGASAASAAYFNNPLDYVAHLDGDHLDWLRSQLSLLLVCGQGQWEDTTGALESTTRLAGAAREQGDPARARPVGARRPARLAVVARPDRPPSAAVLLMARRPRT